MSTTDQSRGAPALRVSRVGRTALSPTVALALLVAGCSDGADRSADESPFGTGQRSQRQFSPGTAAALSVMTSNAEVASDPFQAAVDCTAALQVTLKFLPRLPQASANDVASLRQAEGFFRERASRLADDTPASQAIAAKVQEVQGNPAPQVQLAIACLRQGPTAS